MVRWERVNDDGTITLLKEFATVDEAAKYWRSLPDPDNPKEEPKNGCWNCFNYDDGRCMKDCYYLHDQYDKEPTDWCEDHGKDDSIKWEDWFEEE